MGESPDHLPATDKEFQYKGTLLCQSLELNKPETSILKITGHNRAHKLRADFIGPIPGSEKITDR